MLLVVGLLTLSQERERENITEVEMREKERKWIEACERKQEGSVVDL